MLLLGLQNGGDGMRINTRVWHRRLIFLSIVLMPITALDVPVFSSIFRGLSEEAAFYPLFFGILLWFGEKLLRKQKIHLPRNISFKLFLFFLGWVLLSGLLNISDIYSNSFRGVLGGTRFITLFIGFLFFSIVLLYLFDNLRNDREWLLGNFERAIFFSFFLAGGYSVFEILRYVGITFASDVLKVFDSIIRSAPAVNPFEMRLHSICMEPSFFGFFASIMFPWVFGAVFLRGHRLWFLFLNLYLIILLLLTFSRSLLVIVVVEFFIMLCLYQYEIRTQKKFFFSFVSVLLVGLVIGLEAVGIAGFRELITWAEGDVFQIFSSLFKLEDESVIARYGSQAAAFNMFLSSPFTGVGLGQYAFWVSEFMPTWAYESEEISNTAFGFVNGVWPICHGLYARLLGEVGGVGLLLWLSIWGTLCYKLICIFSTFDRVESLRCKNLLVSIISYLFFGVMHDSFGMLVIWILMGVSMVLTESDRVRRSDDGNTCNVDNSG